MLRSMTGHGEARAETEAFEFVVEVRSVNHRFLRVSTKISEHVAFLQASLEDDIRKRLHRGSISLTVRFTPLTTVDFYDLDLALLDKYRTTLERYAGEKAPQETIHLRDLLSLPGVVRCDEDATPHPEQVAAVGRGALAEALDRLEAMREREGATLQTELAERRQRLSEQLDRVRELAPEGVREYQKRLEERVEKALQKHEITLEPEDLIKEVAILAERCDISEEILRMASHLEQFHAALEAGGQVGRKLEFLLQEMFRETNTMGSKSIHPELNRIVVDAKAELDRLKEQVQNIE